MNRKRLQPSSPPSLPRLFYVSVHVHGVYVMYTSDVFFTGMDGWMDGFMQGSTEYIQVVSKKASKSNQSKKKLLNLVQHQVINILFFLLLFLSDHCNISVRLKSGCAGLLYLDSSYNVDSYSSNFSVIFH